ncbi:MAG: hypothetical protein JOZ15_04545 [Acidobacteria bacterium]|nr:hypothetical protein [Acidobacteriota bacterium]
MRSRLHTRSLFKLSTTVALLATVAGPLIPVATSASGGKGEPIPEVLMDPPLPTPYWVSASAVLLPDGTLDSKRFHPAVARQIRDLLSQPEVNGCIHLGTVWEDYIDPQDRSSLEAAAASAELIFTARVVGATPGFAAEVPGTLLAVRPTEWIKGDQRAAQYFVFFPIGDVSVGSKRICKTDNRYAALPRLGDEVLVFTQRSFNPANPIIHVKNPGDLVTLRGDEVLLPRQYRADRPAPLTPQEKPAAAPAEPKTRHELMALVSAALAGSKP